ncbi:MAG: hypothetical protein SO188_02335 [Prevotella sp.]|nr:hypothetical protein [Prevotella sp.]
MEINEYKTSKLEELSKDIKSLEDKDFDKSLGRNDEEYNKLIGMLKKACRHQ